MILSDIKAAIKQGVYISEQDKAKYEKHMERKKLKADSSLTLTIHFEKNADNEIVIEAFRKFAKGGYQNMGEAFLSLAKGKFFPYDH